MKHRHHIVPLHDGGANDASNLTPPISVALHAAFHRDRYESLGQVGDYVAWQMLTKQMSTSEAKRLLQLEGAKRGGLAHRGIKKPRRAVATPEYREKMRVVMTAARQTKKSWYNGRKVLSQETRNKLSEASKRMWSRRKESANACCG